MIWYWYCCYPLFWCVCEEACTVSHSTEWESGGCGRGSRWGGGVKLKLWKQRWWCPDGPIAFQKWLSFKTHWGLQGRCCSKRGQFSMWLTSCLRPFTPTERFWTISEDNDLASYIPHRKSRSPLPVQYCTTSHAPVYLNTWIVLSNSNSGKVFRDICWTTWEWQVWRSKTHYVSLRMILIS